MGTVEVEIKKLQSKITTYLKELGWSQKRLAEEVYAEKYGDYDIDETEINRTKERIKKNLQREIKNKGVLLDYLKVIENHSDFEKLKLIIPRHVPSKHLSCLMKKKIKIISHKITKKLEEHAL